MEEQAEVAQPAALVVVAEYVRVSSGGTETVIPAPANCAAVPVAAGEPEQSLVAYSVTVAPSVVPDTVGFPTFAGEAGVVASRTGGSIVVVLRKRDEESRASRRHCRSHPVCRRR